MRSIRFQDNGWDDYLYWQGQDKKTLKRINMLIKDIVRSPFEGIGKPEQLRHRDDGAWSRRIDDFNRIVYLIEKDVIVILSCKLHY